MLGQFRLVKPQNNAVLQDLCILAPRLCPNLHIKMDFLKQSAFAHVVPTGTPLKAKTMKTETKGKEISKEMKASDFHQFFIEELKDIYWAEEHLTKALPKMKKAATSKKLAAAFDKHSMETQEHVQRLESVFELLGEKAKGKKCDAMEGLVKEAESIIQDTSKDSKTRDAGLILAAQKVEHYEIATYGTLRTLANVMGHTDVEKLLQQTLDNEKETDVTLTRVAEGFINEQAAKE